MSGPSLKEKLMDKLREIEDPAILAELSNLFEIQEPETLYKVSSAQKKSIEKGVAHVGIGLTISSFQADCEIEKYIFSK
jgi:hypothetical protein